MDPWRTYLQALFATERAWRHLANRVGMDAFVRHQCLLVLAGSEALSPSFARKACSSATTCAPSPTAAATRLTEPERTSPIANTPSRVVSSGLWMFAPARTKPLSSSITPDRDSHSVFGSAPMNRKRWRIANFFSSPDRWEWQRIASRSPSCPSRAVTVVSVRISTFTALEGQDGLLEAIR